MSSRSASRLYLLAILTCAVALRVWYVTAGVPFAVAVDEPAVVDRGLRILNTGDWNPHVFDYPTLVIYWQAVLSMATFLAGASRAKWTSLGTMDIGAVYSVGRVATALLGAGTVWLVYRIGKDLHSEMLGLIAALQLAVQPLHVRESHFILTDVPATALVTLTLYLALRAGRERTVSSYAWAGMAAGLSAAAKYNGVVVFIAVLVTWLLHERDAPGQWWKIVASAAAMLAAFAITVPYAVLDLPSFLNGFGAQLARFAARPGQSNWLTYVIHLSLSWRFWVPMAILGVVLVAWERGEWKAWAAQIGFVFAYYYVLSTHSVAFARYALPLLPGVCLLAAVPIVHLVKYAQKQFSHPMVTPAAVAVGTALVSVFFMSDSIAWLKQYHQQDTRQIAAQWMMANLPAGSRVVVENSGPTNLNYAGFQIPERPDILEDDIVASYRKQGIEYFLTAPWSADEPTRGPAVNKDLVIFGVAPTERRWGPYIRIVKFGTD